MTIPKEILWIYNLIKISWRIHPITLAKINTSAYTDTFYLLPCKVLYPGLLSLLSFNTCFDAVTKNLLSKLAQTSLSQNNKNPSTITNIIPSRDSNWSKISLKSSLANKSEPWWLFCSFFSFFASNTNDSFLALSMAWFNPSKSIAAGESQLAKPVSLSIGIWSSD